MIRAILFDLGNVLVPVNFIRCREALAEVCVHPPKEVQRILGESGLPKQYESGQVSSAEFFDATCRLLDMNVSYEKFAQVWGEIFSPEPLVPETLLESLRTRHRLILLSNTNDMHFTLAEQRYPLLRHFDEYILSYRVGAMKPDSAIYERAIAAAGCAPGECFFIDDLTENVEGARRVGMDATLFTTFTQLRVELLERSLLPAC
jgi:HAD superfamily hydrolase (TIGR01509 family)